MRIFPNFQSGIFLLLFLLVFNTLAMAQQPAQVNYQGVARKADGSPVANQQVGLRLSIHDGGTNSPVVYSETRRLTTNAFGLFTTVIGSPGASSQSGSMSAVAWASGNKFLQVELDPAGGTNFQDLGTSQLQSVPYAIFASQALPAGTAAGDLGASYPNPTVTRIQGSPVSTAAPQSGQVLTWNGTSWAPANAATTGGQPVSITASLPLIVSAVNGNSSLSLGKSAANADGYLSKSDWTLFNDKPSKAYVDAAVASVALVDGSITDAKISTGINPSKVGLGNVNNTSDVAKPVSDAAQRALDARELLSNKSVNVITDATSDTKYPSVRSVKTYLDAAIASVEVPYATSAAAGKIQLAGDLSGNAASPLIADGKITTTKLVDGSVTDAKISTGINPSKVGLGNVNNTSDAAKPVSDAAQLALDARELLSNKSVNINTDAASDTKYPSVKSVKIYVDAAATPDADATIKGKIQIAGDLAGPATFAVISPGALNDAKIAVNAAIADTKLATISTAGKVANSATTAVSANTASTIVARDVSGNFAAGTITASLTGTASASTNISGGSVGTIPYQSASNTTAMLAVGTAGQVLQSNGAAAPSWVTIGGPVRDVADEFTATSSQTSFTLTQSPSANSKVKMYINGVRISNAAYSWTGTALTYTPANNGSYALTAGDRVQLDYYY